MGPAALSEAVERNRAAGRVPVELNGFASAGEDRYSIVWSQEPDASWQLTAGLDSGQFAEEARRLADSGWAPVSLSIHANGAALRYGAAWRLADGPWELRYDITDAELTSLLQSMGRAGYAPIAVSGYMRDGRENYGVVWKQRPAGTTVELRTSLTAAEFQAAYDRLTPQGYVPVDISVYPVGGAVRYAAIWEKVDGVQWEARHAQSRQAFVDEASRLSAQGYAPYAIAAHALDGTVEYAGAWRRMGVAPRRMDSAPDVPVRTFPGSAQGRVLPIPPVLQQTPVWCWLAVGEMVFRYYDLPNANPAGNYQCGIIGRISHPASPCSSNCFACVVPSGSNQGTLAMFGNYAHAMAGRTVTYVETGTLPPAMLIAEIEAGRPVLAGVSTTRRRAELDAEHVALIVGYEARGGDLSVVVNDPFPYPADANPYLLHGGTVLELNQYRIGYDALRDGVFWHWSVYDLRL